MKPSPTLRFAFAFWIGWMFHLAFGLAAQLFTNDNTVLGVVGVVAGIVLVALYNINKSRFGKEFLWMTIKNPMKVKYEEDEMLVQTGPATKALRKKLNIKQPSGSRGTK